MVKIMENSEKITEGTSKGVFGGIVEEFLTRSLDEFKEKFLFLAKCSSSRIPGRIPRGIPGKIPREVS